MKPKWILASLASVVLVAAVTAMGVARAADEKKAQPAAGKMDEKAMMEAWAKYANPGAAHKHLEQFVGTWDTTTKMWMAPGAQPTESKGTSENKMILNGRYLEQRYEGTMMDQPFTGLGYTGYDNYKKKYVGSWMDSMGTAMMNSTGTADAAGKKFTIVGDMDDVMTGKRVKLKETITVVDNDHHIFEMWGPDPKGKNYKMMEIHYTRRK